MEKRKVLFLCTGNSCRSQMAEAIVNHLLHEDWEAYSAGTDPAGNVHPTAILVLSENGITHEGRSKHVDEFRQVDLDLVITVCGDAEARCPVWLGGGKRAHIGFPDPALAVGSRPEILNVFRGVFDDIERQIVGYLKKLERENSGE